MWTNLEVIVITAISALIGTTVGIAFMCLAITGAGEQRGDDPARDGGRIHKA